MEVLFASLALREWNPPVKGPGFEYLYSSMVSHKNRVSWMQSSCAEERRKYMQIQIQIWNDVCKFHCFKTAQYISLA